MTAAKSARGLFRATGKASRPVKTLFEDGSIGEADALPREKNDFYPTPREPTDALVAVEASRLRSFGTIWEPACGDGAMMRDLARHGFSVIGSDLVDRGCGAEVRDFFDYRAAPSRCVVTNPPFRAVNWRDGRGRWIEHAFEGLGLDYMALLLPWGWPGAGGLAPLWQRLPPSRVYLMRWKIDFTGQGAPPMLNAWFVWDRAAEAPETVLRMLDRVDPGQGTMFEGGRS